MQDILGWALIYMVFLGALMSPGPDFLLVLRNATGYSRRAGVFTALGIAAGNSIHMSYCLAGIGLLILQSVVLFNVIKWIGAGYLIYMGICALRSKGMGVKDMQASAHIHGRGKNGKRAFADGFICNVLNPKATMFFIALFSQMIDPVTPLVVQLVFCAVVMITAFIWFAFVSFVMDVQMVQRSYSAASKWIDRVFGSFFIALGAKLALLN